MTWQGLPRLGGMLQCNMQRFRAGILSNISIPLFCFMIKLASSSNYNLSEGVGLKSKRDRRLVNGSHAIEINPIVLHFAVLRPEAAARMCWLPPSPLNHLAVTGFIVVMMVSCSIMSRKMVRHRVRYRPAIETGPNQLYVIKKAVCSLSRKNPFADQFEPQANFPFKLPPTS
ncbi:hypothetical protein V1523DRAFT_406327 [Lipomyces doorenjongii]